MLFNSPEFILYFLPCVLIGFFLIGSIGHHRSAITWLVAASLFFYGWWNPFYLFIILASIFFNYAIGAALSSPEVRNRRMLLGFGIAANLAALGYFKYAGFLVSTINDVFAAGIYLDAVVLPLAISFFTFQQITYLVDAYRGKTKEYSLLHYLLFVTFFPQLIAGPIVHHREMIPQFSLDSIYRIQWSSGFGSGAAVFLIGLFKKVVIADGVAAYATPVFDAAESGVPITFFEAWAAALSYTFQLYFDFSGYSDMAIGLALMFNIRLPLNFASPYKAANIIEFWRRWHMTLSGFLRDYIYIPLGGNRRGRPRRYANLMTTMLLGGLWHGAGWTFVVWGGLHGFYLVVNHAWHALRRKVGWYSGGPRFATQAISWTLTFLAVVVAWVVFRAETFGGAQNILSGMVGRHGFVLPTQVAAVLPLELPFIETVGKMPLLGEGTVMGVFELLGMLALCFALIAMPATQEMSNGLRLAAVVAGFYFAVQAVFFGRAPTEFLYFQF